MPGSLQFTNNSGGTSSLLRIGDRWTIRISGAPNSPVVVVGGKNGAMDSMAMGATDAAGNFELAGTITADQVGSWFEQWSVGGQPVGQFAFTIPPAVTAPAIGAVPQTSPTAAVSPRDYVEPCGIMPCPPDPSSVAQVALRTASSIPTWGWLVAAGVGAFVLFGGRRR